METFYFIDRFSRKQIEMACEDQGLDYIVGEGFVAVDLELNSEYDQIEMALKSPNKYDRIYGYGD